VANFIWYGEALEGLLKGSIDFDTDTFKLALLDADYVFNQDTHDFFDDVSAEQITGTGYTAGGVTLSRHGRLRRHVQRGAGAVGRRFVGDRDVRVPVRRHLQGDRRRGLHRPVGGVR
jgi:hypothetical protein